MKRIHYMLRMQAFAFRNALLLEDGGQQNAVGKSEAFHQLSLEDVAAQSVGAGLENRPEALALIGKGIGLAQGAQRFANRGGVMGKVVDDGDSVDDGADFKAPLDAVKAGNSGLDRGDRDSVPMRQSCGRSSIERIVLAG